MAKRTVTLPRGAHAVGQDYAPAEDRPGHVKCNVCRSIVPEAEKILHACHHIHDCGHPFACNECHGHGEHTNWCRYRLSDLSHPKVRAQHAATIADALLLIATVREQLPHIEAALRARPMSVEHARNLRSYLHDLSEGAARALRDPMKDKLPWRGPKACTCAGAPDRFCIHSRGDSVDAIYDDVIDEEEGTEDLQPTESFSTAEPQGAELTLFT